MALSRRVKCCKIVAPQHGCNTPKFSSPFPDSLYGFCPATVLPPLKVEDNAMVKSTKRESGRAESMADWPPYWFTRLWKGISEGDLRKSAEAQDHLKRLGYEVSVRPPNQGVTA
jgi:hypothetical protein